MLQQLVINNLAIIDNLNIDFHSGMTVLTGETGAGKSILLDALGLMLGDRADVHLIRAGAEKTDVSAVFSIDNNSDVIDRLNNMDMKSENELFIRRTISKDGRSRAYINNTPVPIQALKEMGEDLIDIHGQHAHQSLSRPTTQRQLLDEFGQYDPLLSDLQIVYKEWKQVNQQLQNFKTEDKNFEARLTLLRYQIEELEQLDIGKSEYEEISEEHKRQIHSQRLLDSCNKILADLSGSETAIEDQIAHHRKEMNELCRFDNSLENVSKLFDSATIHIEEARHELKDYVEQFDMDNERLGSIENRLDKLHELARKHKVKPETLPEHLTLLSKQLKQLEGGQKRHDLLQKKQIELNERYFKLAKKLSKKRIAAATKMSQAVTKKMHELAIGGKFNIDLKKIDDTTPHQFGMDKISFLVSTNPGQTLRPMTKVASGGELSRLSLAIQIIGAKDKGAPTMIFDEVDAGISGGIAEIVGKLLHCLAKHRQILCVTHLAQVAAYGHHHLRVNKITKADATFTQVASLDKQQRIDEVARLLAGMEVTNESRANASKMLESV